MVHLPSQNGVIVEIDVEEALNERGDDGYLYYDGENAIYFDYTMREVGLERSNVLLGYYCIDKYGEG